MPSNPSINVPRVRPELHDISPDYHGAIDFAELFAHNINPDEIIDFSVNSNPFGPSQTILSYLNIIPPNLLSRYPDKECWELRKQLAKHNQCKIEQLLIGNGTAELIWKLCFAMIRPNDSVLTITPTFGEYARMARLMGATVFSHQTLPQDNFNCCTDRVNQLLTELTPRLFFICNPNNPTGQLISNEQIKQWATDHPSTLLVIDEAYISFVDGMKSAAELNLPNILCLRSMTKDYSLAGIRLGYILAFPSLVQGLSNCRIPWSVNGIAQKLGGLAIETNDHYVSSFTRLQNTAEHLKNSLMEMGYPVVPTATHYFLMNVGDGQSFREKLLHKKMLVRLCESYDLPRYVRIAAQTEEQNEQLITAIRQITK